MEKRRSMDLLFFLLALLIPFCVEAQNRDVEALVEENLALLPTQDDSQYGKVIRALASAGEQGVVLIAQRIKPDDAEENEKYEYALNSMADYVMRVGDRSLRAGLVRGLTQAVDRSTDNPTKAFLLSTLTKCATSEEYEVYLKYLDDPYLQDFALSGMAQLPGVDEQVVKLIQADKAPRLKLAYLAYFRKLEGVESTLLGWLPGADEKTTSSIYQALTVCGSSKSVKALGKASRRVGYDIDPTGATDAWLQILHQKGKPKDQAKAGKIFSQLQKPGYRAAGLLLRMKAAGKKCPQVILQALADEDVQYRATALDYAEECVGENIYGLVAEKFQTLSPEAQADVTLWLQNHHKESVLHENR